MNKLIGLLRLCLSVGAGTIRCAVARKEIALSVPKITNVVGIYRDMVLTPYCGNAWRIVNDCALAWRVSTWEF